MAQTVTPTGRRGRTTWVLVGAAAVTVAVGAAVALAVFDGRGPGNADRAAEPSATLIAAPETSNPEASRADAGTPTRTPATGPIEITWSEQPFEGFVEAVTVDQDRFVAVGSTDDGLAAWTSDDADAWERHGVPNPYPEYEGMTGVGPSMGPLARLEDTLFSLGTVIARTDARWPVGWRSADGATWEAIE